MPSFNMLNKTQTRPLLLIAAFMTSIVGFPAELKVNKATQATQASAKEVAKPVPLKLDLGDLGFSKQESSADIQSQQILRERSSSLQIHQVLGLVTLGLMTATYFTAPEHNAASIWHRSFAIASAASYASTAYFSLTAPEVEGMKETGWNMKIHRSLVFIHMPGMILTPIAGIMAHNARKAGKEPTGLGKYKGALANITYFSFAAAALSVTINF